jgi:hypothetical protein
MKDFKYRATFTSFAEVIQPEKETLEAFASAKSDLEGLAGLFPVGEKEIYSEDLLWFTCNAANPNYSNLNHDLVLSDGAVKLAKGVKYKPVDLEHKREVMLGVLTNAGFSEYGTNKLISEEEVLASNKPVNLAVVGCLWKIAGDITDVIEEASSPLSENYKKISVSWELGFNRFSVLLGSKDASKGIIKRGEEAKPYYKYLRAEGGAGIDDNGLEVYRIIEDGIFLGIGITTNPAASVEGILTFKPEEPTMEVETPEPEEMEPEEESEKEGKKIKVEIEIEAADNKNKTLNKPFRLPTGSNKKFGVYVKNDKGNVVMVKFGDPNMEIKRDDPERRKAYRSRHSCDTPGPKWKANYWSCRMWSSKPVSSIASVLDFEEWDGETEFNHDEILSICPEYADAEIIDEIFEEKDEKSEKNISTSEILPVTNPRPMKFDNQEQALAHLLEAQASLPTAKELREYFLGEFSKANDLYEAAKAEKEAAQKELQDAIAASQQSTSEIEALKAKVDLMEAQAREKEAQDIFDSRFSALAAEYDIEDAKVRASIAKQITDLDEPGYQHWLANDGEVILANRIKQKPQVNVEEATASMKEASASIDIPNSQDVSDKQGISLAELAKAIQFKK